jgi:hypothetical protein
MEPDIASLMSNISFWEFWGYVALGAVLVGVAGESIKEFTDWPKRIGYEKAITRLSALILIAGLAGEGVTQPTTNAANATLVALLNKQAGQLAIDLERERTKTAARPWKKEQFDAIQEIKRIVKDVGIVVTTNCIECRMYATYIEIALHNAGVQMYGDDTIAYGGSTGIFILLPPGEDLTTHPLVGAFRKAGLNPAVARHLPEFSKIRTDIPVIFVGEKWPEFLTFPYQPSEGSQWTILPLRK